MMVLADKGFKIAITQTRGNNKVWITLLPQTARKKWTTYRRENLFSDFGHQVAQNYGLWWNENKQVEPHGCQSILLKVNLGP